MVTVYTKNRCAACTATKKKMTQLGIPYTEINVQEAPEALETLKKLGWQQLPVVEHKTTSWSGFQPDRIENLKFIL